MASATLMDSTRLVLNVYGGATFGEVQVKLPGRRGWISIPRHKEVAPEVLETYQFNKTLEKRSRPIRIRYRDPSMRFSCRCVVRTW